VVGENDVIILKAISLPAMGEFDTLIAEAKRQANRPVLNRRMPMRPFPRCAAANEGDPRHHVFVSGEFFGGPPHRILQGWCDGRVKLCCPQKFSLSGGP